MQESPGTTLSDALAADYLLGEAHPQTYGSQLGGLVKLIDTEERLAIQVHPTKARTKDMYFNDRQIRKDD